MSTGVRSKKTVLWSGAFNRSRSPLPPKPKAIQILQGIKEKYESFHQLKYTDEALENAVYLSNRYISDRFLPDKAIDLIDEAGARVKLRSISVPEELINIQRRIRIIGGRIETAISAQEFEKAARYRLEEDVEQENLQVSQGDAGGSKAPSH